MGGGRLVGAQHVVRATSSEILGVLGAMSAERDTAGVAVVLEPVQKSEADFPPADGAYDPAHALQRKRRGQLGVLASPYTDG